MKVRRMTRRKAPARSSSALRAVRLSRAARKAHTKLFSRKIKVRKNFLPLLAVPLIAPIAAGGALVVGYYLYKRTQDLSTIVSVPAVLGGGVGFAVAYQTKADNTMKFVYSVIGYTAGMLVQNYVIVPNAAAAAAADCKNSSWLTPWKWCW